MTQLGETPELAQAAPAPESALAAPAPELVPAAAAEPEVAPAQAAPAAPPAFAALDTSETPRFAGDDPEMLAYLHEHGYAVVAGVADEAELQRAEGLLWQFLGDAAGWAREDTSTWSHETFGSMGMPEYGIINGRGVGQCDLSWFLRTRPRVRRAFESIWRDSELLTSFDGIGVFLPWHGGFPKTMGGWFHVDQGRTKLGLHCVQGLVSLFDQGAQTGGLVVVPGSHRRHDEVVAAAQARVGDDDFIHVEASSPVVLATTPRLVSCRAGDMVLWDSRTVHCNTPAVEAPTSPPERLLRAVVYICMTPKAWASAEALNMRRKGYAIRMTTSHWPHTGAMGWGWGRAPRLNFEEAGEERRALIC